MSPQTTRVIGFLLIVTAAIVAILNLKRTANLSMPWLSAPLLVIGVALVVMARRRR